MSKPPTSEQSRNMIAGLRNELHALRLEWDQIVVQCVEPPDWAYDSEESWREATLTDFPLHNSLEPDGQVYAFGDARFMTLWKSSNLFAIQFSDWSRRVVELMHAQFDMSNIPDPQLMSAVEIRQSRLSTIVKVAGTSDAVIAGTRIMFWAAAFKTPAAFRRSQEMNHIVLEWTNQLIEYGVGRWRTLREVMDWVQQAFEVLVAERERPDVTGRSPNSLPASAEKTPAEPAVDGTAFVKAGTLREQRGMTAQRCNKFLKDNGTQSPNVVAGKIRYRKPNKKALEIHSGDWLLFWSERDRLQSEALDEEGLQSAIADVETRKAEARKAKRK